MPEGISRSGASLPGGAPGLENPFHAARVPLVARIFVHGAAAPVHRKRGCPRSRPDRGIVYRESILDGIRRDAGETFDSPIHALTAPCGRPSAPVPFLPAPAPLFSV